MHSPEDHWRCFATPQNFSGPRRSFEPPGVFFLYPRRVLGHPGVMCTPIKKATHPKNTFSGVRTTPPAPPKTTFGGSRTPPGPLKLFSRVRDHFPNPQTGFLYFGSTSPPPQPQNTTCGGCRTPPIPPKAICLGVRPPPLPRNTNFVGVRDPPKPQT